MMLKWLALRDSNPRLADYEPAVLTAELRAGEFRGHVGTGTRAGARGHSGTRTWGQGGDQSCKGAKRSGAPVQKCKGGIREYGV
jgi:hypothetical protein